MAIKITKKDKDAIALYVERVAWVVENAGHGTFENKQQRAVAIKRAKGDYAYMIKRYFSHIADCETGAFQIELANMVKRKATWKGFAEWPRGHAKTTHCCLFIPFWLYINGQNPYFLQISNCFDAAAEILDELRAELEANPIIIQDFGVQKVVGKKWESGYFVTKGGFIGRALGIGQKVRGLKVGSQRPTLCNVDDLETEELNSNPKRQDAAADWIERSLIPTMIDNYRRFIYSSNRWAERMVQTILQKRHPKWKVHHIKAYNPKTLEPIAWPQMYSLEYWVAQVKELGSLVCEAEYNQKPHKEGKIFLDKYFRYEKIPRIDHFDSVLAYWDPAYSDSDTADSNAIRVWGRKGDYYYLIRSFVRQCEMVDALEWMFLYQSILPKGFILRFYYEKQFYNKTLETTYKKVRLKHNKHNLEISLICDDDRKGNKYQRMIATLLPLYQQLRIIFNKSEESTEDFKIGKAQLKSLEPGYKTHDDAPDADHGAITKLSGEYDPKDVDQQTTHGGSRRNKRY